MCANKLHNVNNLFTEKQNKTKENKKVLSINPKHPQSSSYLAAIKSPEFETGLWVSDF